MGTQTIIIGGTYGAKSVTYFTSSNNIWKTRQNISLRKVFFSNGTEVSEELATEVWDFETGNNWIFEPSLFPTADGIALYFVDANFCNSPNSEDESPM